MSVLKFFTNTGHIVEIDEDKEIHRGGEGRIIIPEKIYDKAAKIYHDNIQPITVEKFKSLQNLKSNYFILPSDLLYDDKKHIRGFLMPLITNDYYPIASVFNSNFCNKNKITVLFKKEIVKQLIEIVKIAHENEIIIGDFNQYNILLNNKCNLKVIDTDSFATKKIPHSGILLEDIRDYLYNGNVNESSDYFALSVLIFNLFTYSHPFKGIHKKFKSLRDRMINKIPVYLSDNDLVQPKCYVPVNDKKLQKQFDFLYLIGNRFLFSLDGVTDDILKQIKIPETDKFIQKNIIITRILPDVNIHDIFFNNSIGYIETENHFFVYNSENKGFLSIITEFEKNKVNQVYIGSKNIFFCKENKLFQYISETENHEIKNFIFDDNSIIKQYENILLVLSEDILYKIDLDKVIGNNIFLHRTNVFGRGFKNMASFVQNTGGILRMFYNTGKDISNVKLTDKVLNIKQISNICLIQTEENKEIKNKFLKINGLNVEQTNFYIDNFADFTLLKFEKVEAMILLPDDNKLKVIRSIDFKLISEFECEIITQQTKIQLSKSGILALENGKLYLLNINN